MRVLEESLHILAAEHHQLETSLRRPSAGATPTATTAAVAGSGAPSGGVHTESEEEIQSDLEEFYDCIDKSKLLLLCLLEPTWTLLKYLVVWSDVLTY